MREKITSNVLEHGSQFGGQDLGDAEPVRLLSKRNTARILGGITEREVEKRIADGDLESVLLGRRRLIVASSVDAYVARLRAEAAAVRGAA